MNIFTARSILKKLQEQIDWQKQLRYEDLEATAKLRKTVALLLDHLDLEQTIEKPTLRRKPEATKL